MSVFRVNKEKNFTTVSNHILRNKSASLKAKGLLVWMLSCDEAWNFSLSGMQACLKEKEDAITSTIKELETLGYLVRTKLMPETDKETGEVIRSRVEWVYDIYEEPKILPTDFQCVENQSTENPVIRNTKDKEIQNIKRASSPRLSSPKHSRNFQKETTQLTDKLSSGAEIAEQEEKKKKKRSQKELCLEEIEEAKYQFSNEEKVKLTEYLEWAMSGRDNRRIRNVELWRTKLNTLLQLREEGCDLCKVIQNSIEKKWYIFVDEKQDHSKKQTSSFRPAGDEKIKSSPFKSREEVQAEMERRTLAGMPDFD